MKTPGRARALFLLVLTVIIWGGCRDEDPVGDERNRPPETYLVQSPQFNQSGYYINHLFWDGYDVDGRVEYFETALADSAGVLDDVSWKATFRTDSLVRFPVGGEEGHDQVLGNRFYVRAVDNVGRPDPTPAWIFFGARDAVFPEVIYTRARGWSPTWPTPADPETLALGASEDCGSGASGFPPDTLPSGARVEFRWYGVDRDSILGQQVGSVTGFWYFLLPLESGLDSLGGTLADTARAYTDLQPGTYTFTVRTTDDGGLQSQSCQYFHVNFDPVTTVADVEDDCTGEMVRAYRIGTQQISSSSTFCDPTFEPWSPGIVNLPPLPDDPCLPDGWFRMADTLAVAVDPGTGWWLEFTADAEDTDGSVDHLEVSVRECNPRTGLCPAQPWDCAPIGADQQTIYVGPFDSGDYQVVVAAVDDAGQRGASSADTIDIRVDRSPKLVMKNWGTPVTPQCDCLFGTIGDTVQVCAYPDSVAVVARIPSDDPEGAAVPCPELMMFNSTASGDTVPVTVYDYQSFPQDGDVLDLVFHEDQNGRQVAEICCVQFVRDLDGDGNAHFIRYQLDEPLGLSPAFEKILPRSAPVPAAGFAPACFPVTIVQDAEAAQHTLYLEVRDWLRSDISEARVAERTSAYEIRFTVNKLNPNRRYQLPRRNGS